MNISKTDYAAFARLILTPGETELMRKNLLEFEEEVGIVAAGLFDRTTLHQLSNVRSERVEQSSRSPEPPTPIALMPTYGMELPQAG